MLHWDNRIIPIRILSASREAVKTACVALVRSGQIGGEIALPPTCLHLVSGGSECREEVEWRMKLLSTDAGFGGIYGCSFRMFTTFDGKPAWMTFLISHTHLKRAIAEALVH